MLAQKDLVIVLRFFGCGKRELTYSIARGAVAAGVTQLARQAHKAPRQLKGKLLFADTNRASEDECIGNSLRNDEARQRFPDIPVSDQLLHFRKSVTIPARVACVSSIDPF